MSISLLPGSECEQRHKRFFSENAALMGVPTGTAYQSMMVRKIADAIESEMLNAAGLWRSYDAFPKSRNRYVMMCDFQKSSDASWTKPGILLASGQELKDQSRIPKKVLLDDPCYCHCHDI